MIPKLLVLAAAIACTFVAGKAQANGVDPTVVSGQARFSALGTSFNITNSPGAIINWHGFSIGAGETTRFIQQSAASSVLNRVVGPDPSFILGTLTSNGRVFLINPSGILVGQGAHIDVAGLVASTLNLSNQDFLAGRLNFTPNLLSGKVENLGTITTPSGGSVYLVGSTVSNSGIINSPRGDVILAAGQSVKIFDSSTPGVRVELTASDNAAVNLGEILAQCGQIGIYGAALRNAGIINADQVGRDASGKIVLRGKQDVTLDAGSRLSANGEQGGEITVQSETGTTLVSGTIETKGSGAVAAKGGTVQLLGDRVGLIAASVDASGTAGGGTALVGGDYQGQSPSVQNASATYVGPNASVKADAITSGNGGKVIVWADNVTRFQGNVSARGGSNSGDGGFVEVSGKHYLDFRGMADTRAPMGRAGTLLLDPDEIQIINAAGGATLRMTCLGGGDCTTPSGAGPYTDNASAFDPATPGSVGILPDNSINQQLAFGNVTVKTSLGGILISNVNGEVAIGPVTGSTDAVPGAVPGPNANTLTLDSAKNISWDAVWSYKNLGQLTLRARDGSIAGTTALTLVDASPVLLQATTNIGSSGSLMAITGNGGNVTISAGTSATLGNISAGTGTISVTSSGVGDITISGALTNTNSGTSAVVLNSTSGTGNVISNSGSISTSGRATIFTKTVAGSTGLNVLVGDASGKFRYNGVTTGLGATGTYAVYTEQPFLAVAANNDSKVYGTNDPAQSYAPVTGYVNGDTAGLTGSYARTAGELVSASPYAITQGTVASSVGYGITFTSGQMLTIGAKSLTALLPDQTKTYGTNDPALALGVPAANLTGLVNATATNWMGTGTVIDDSALTSTASALVRQVGESVGSYNITAGTFTAPSTNYSAPSYLGAPKLTISAKNLSVLLPDQTKTYGTNDPALALGVPAANLTGLVHATATNWMGTGTVIDDGALTSTASALVRQVGESVGSYNITAGTFSAPSANYNAPSY
ncbi:MAG: MBG domain-containing protein, partial [Proteobacteria bacterium]|nr:MBG domain-containing protein [Pseudomonadota bacterium]